MAVNGKAGRILRLTDREGDEWFWSHDNKYRWRGTGVPTELSTIRADYGPIKVIEWDGEARRNKAERIADLEAQVARLVAALDHVASQASVAVTLAKLAGEEIRGIDERVEGLEGYVSNLHEEAQEAAAEQLATHLVLRNNAGSMVVETRSGEVLFGIAYRPETEDCWPSISVLPAAGKILETADGMRQVESIDFFVSPDEEAL